MEIDWTTNLLAIASAIIFFMLWVSLWNIVELSVEIFIDNHKNANRSKYTVYFSLFILSVLLLLLFHNSIISAENINIVSAGKIH